MSAIAIFVVGAIVTGLCVAFVWITHHEVKRRGSEPEKQTRFTQYL
jgi:hypothetical protein